MSNIIETAKGNPIISLVIGVIVLLVLYKYFYRSEHLNTTSTIGIIVAVIAVILVILFVVSGDSPSSFFL